MLQMHINAHWLLIHECEGPMNWWSWHKKENKRKWYNPQPARRLGDWALKVRERYGGMWKMNLGRSVKTDWIQKKDKTELVLPCRFISEGFRCLKWSHVFNYRIYRIIILLRMEFIMPTGIFLFLVSRFLLAFPRIHFVLGVGGSASEASVKHPETILIVRDAL